MDINFDVFPDFQQIACYATCVIYRYTVYVLLIGGNFLLLVLDAGAEFQISKIIYSLELEGAFEIQARAK